MIDYALHKWYVGLSLGGTLCEGTRQEGGVGSLERSTT